MFIFDYLYGTIIASYSTTLYTEPIDHTFIILKPGNKNVPTSQTSNVSRIEPAKRREHTPSRRRSRSSYRYTAAVRRYRLLLAGISILFLVILIFSWLHAARNSSGQHQAMLDLRKQEVLAKSLTAELGTIKNERDILVQGRIPGLIPLKYDEAINIDNEYVRNIIFTLAKVGKKNIHEYRLVLHNNTLSIARPKARIILFSDIGMQVGMAQIEHSDTATDTDTRTTLDPGEVRSYTAAINLIRNEEPSYFLLDIAVTGNTSTDKLRKQLDGVITP